MEDFTFYDFGNGSSCRIGDDQIAINHKKNNYSITFSQTKSKEILKSGLKRVRIRVDNITGEIHFVINNDFGAILGRTGSGSSVNVKIGNKQLVKFLCNRLKFDEKSDRDLVYISNDLANNKDYITYKIIG